MTTVTVSERLRQHEEALRSRLASAVGADGASEEGSDAWLLIEALCGAPEEEWRPRFAASGRVLAEQGGRLEVRLASIGAWHAALDAALADLFADEPLVRAEAAALLSRLVTAIVLTLTREYQDARLRQAEEAAERAHRGITRLQALQRINAATNSTLDLDQTLTTAAQAVADEMSADLCVIFLFDDITRELVLRATSGPYPRSGRHFALPMGQGYSGWVAEHGHPLIINDAVEDGRFSVEATAYAAPYRGLLSVPIIFFTGVKLEGVISVQKSDAHTFSDDEVNFLEIVAGQLAMNIENGRLYEQTDEQLRRKVHELSTLHRVSALVTSTLVLDNVLRIIVSQAVLLSGADRSVLFELDPATQRLHVAASHGFEGQDLSQASVKVGQCCIGRVARPGEPSMQVDCMRNDAGCFLHGLEGAIGDQHAVLCAPLTTVHGPLGSLAVFSSRRHNFEPQQRELVVTFANVAAIAMENARLFTQTQQGLRTRELLLREMHHRVKNNLQQVASILSMQGRRTTSPEVEQIVQENVARIQGIAATHDLLSNTNTQLGRAPVDEIARKIIGIVRGNLVPPTLRMRFGIGAVPFYVSSEQAITLAIVLNELIANALEHGYEGRARGEIRISGALEDDLLALRVADDGAGLPSGTSVEKAEGLGLQLVRNLAQNDLRGSVRFLQLHGDPDLASTPGAQALRLTDPKSLAVRKPEADETPTEDRDWTVVELRFPLLPADSANLRTNALAADLS
jgi:two-component sensor histidine kinase